MNTTKETYKDSCIEVVSYVRTATNLLREDKVSDAIEYIKNALQIDPTNPALLDSYKQLSMVMDREIYGQVGLFKKTDPSTDKYVYANWGSRKWEYLYVEQLLNQINIANKNVVDIGIGLPNQYNFHDYYVRSGCNLLAFDPDKRLQEVTRLSEKCHILRQSAEKMDITSDSVDVVVAISSFEHFPAEIFSKTIKETHRILKNDGHLIVTLDLTYNKRVSARWAILEKSLNGFPGHETEHPLEAHHRPLTVEYFLELLAPYFYIKDSNIRNKNLNINDLVYSERWNSHVAYMHLHKR